MEKKLEVSFDGAFNVLSEAVFVYNEKMEIKYFNSAAEKITGFTKADAIGKKCMSLFQGNVCLNNCGLCMTTKTGGEHIRFQSPFVRKDGRKRVGEFNTGLLSRNGNGKLEVLVALSDITEVFDLKEELKKTCSFQNIIGKNPLMRDWPAKIHTAIC